MTSPVGIERKVLRLDGDVHAIYTMLTDIAASQRRLVDQIDYRLAGVEGKLVAMTDAQRRHDDRLDELEDTLIVMKDKLKAVLVLARKEVH